VLENSGIRHNLSDIVGRLRVAPGEYFNLTYRFRVDSRDISFRRQEIAVAGGVPALRATASYVDLADRLGNSEFARRRQIRFAVASQLTQRWSATGGAAFDLVSQRPQPFSMNIGVRYQDECCTITFTYLRSVDLITDTRPTQRFLLSIALKYLGEVRTGR
jgi:LPS-assembly protein